MNKIKIYALTGFTMLVLDMIWLGGIAQSFYFTQLRHLIQEENGKMVVNLPAAALVYVLMVLAFVLFIYPLLKQKGLTPILYSALLGLCLYGVYDLTNKATLKDWPWIVCIVDMTWGMILYSITALVVRFALNKKWVV